MSGADPVVDRARAFLNSVMPILKERCHGANDEAIEAGLPIWVPEPKQVPGMGQFKALPMVFSADRQCALRVLGELREAGMEDLSDLDQELTADAVIGPRIRGDSVISFGAGGGAWQGPSVVLELVEQAISQAGGFDFGAEIDQLTTQWAAALRRPADRVTVVAALREFNAPIVPILVEPGLEIVELSDDEIAAALSLGGGVRGLLPDERTVSQTFGIRVAFDSRLFIGEIPQAEAETEQAAREEAERVVGLVLLALRVFNAGRVSASGTFQYAVRWWGRVSAVGGSVGQDFGWHAGEPYVLAGDDVQRFRDFWLEFKPARHQRVIDSALRRFGYAAERTLPDDKIVDLMIAAESLFLSEMGERDRGELRFRLAARVAALLGSTVDERLSVWKFMRAAYDARSVIVHGGTPAEKDLRNLKRDQVGIDLFADELEGVLRRALQIAIHQLAICKAFPPDWEALMFAGPQDLASG